MKFTSLSLYTPLIASLDWARFRLPLPLAIITLLLLLLLLLLLCIKITNMYQFATGIQGSNPLPVGGASTSGVSIGSSDLHLYSLCLWCLYVVLDVHLSWIVSYDTHSYKNPTNIIKVRTRALEVQSQIHFWKMKNEKYLPYEDLATIYASKAQINRLNYLYMCVPKFGEYHPRQSTCKIWMYIIYNDHTLLYTLLHAH